MNNKSLKWQIPFLVLLIVGTVLILKKQPPFHTDQGLVFGTVYKITYQHADNLKPEIEAALKEVDNSLSPFNKSSVITKINNNTDMTADSLLTDVYTLAKRISEETDGAFDITVAPLVNAWGFGFDSSTNVSRETIDSLRQFVGFEKISLKDGKIIKKDSRTMLDCSAIAKRHSKRLWSGSCGTPARQQRSGKLHDRHRRRTCLERQESENESVENRNKQTDRRFSVSKSGTSDSN